MKPIEPIKPIKLISIFVLSQFRDYFL